MNDTATVEPGASGLLDNVQVNDEATPTNPQAVEIDHKAAVPDALTASDPDDPLERPDFWHGPRGCRDGFTRRDAQHLALMFGGVLVAGPH